jgi:hypothetical protein
MMDEGKMRQMGEMLEIIRAESKRLKIDYLAKFETGDRVLYCPIAYVNIMNPVIPVKKKGVFIESVKEIFCKCIWEGDAEPTVCDVMFIKHDE